MDILDFIDNNDDEYIVKQAMQWYQHYNDWNIVEKEFQNKIDESRDWSAEQVHLYIEHLKSLQRKVLEASTGIFVENEQWYSPRINDNKYWFYYTKTMREKHWSRERIDVLSNECTDIVNFLPNPQRQYDINNKKAFIKKGLIYGNVQSGKTANIAGLISMYASAGCSLIIVLSGVTNNLRLQTQDRLIRDLKILSEPGWHLLTPERDRIGKNQPYAETLLSGRNVSIGVFKKNPFALRSLYAYLKKTTNDDIWKKHQVLIIDDECDQYSPNVELRDEDSDETYKHSSINNLIVNLIKLFPRVSYVGYTATPFANVLNELPGDESLYPEDFIYALSKNESYYGSEKIFGADEDLDAKTLNAINYIEDNECDAIIDGSATTLPASLKDAVNYFILATACKYKRNLTSFSTMLIHINLKTDVHSTIEDLVIEYFDNIREKLQDDDANFLKELENLWDIEKIKNSPQLVCELFPHGKLEDYYLPNFSDLIDAIFDVIQNLEIVVDNSTRPIENRLHYDEENPHPYIVIGGNTLSRGLTLEGLLVSYFSRTSKNYDTLLQMGRWFGYRNGYEDLSRLWMPQKLQEYFSFLCTIENDIREEITNYTFEITPKDFAMRIRLHPSMHITRSRAMQSAQRNMVNFTGTFAETYNLERKDLAIINHNIAATRTLLKGLNCKPEKYHNAWFYRDCDVSHILNYIENYSFSELNRSCTKDSILTYINKALEKNYLHNWNIVVKSNATGKETLQLDDRITCYPVNRARVDEKIDTPHAHFKDFKDARDLMIDADDETWSDKRNAGKIKQIKARKNYYANLNKPVPGMLIIYPINKDSIPRYKSGIQTSLDATQHLIGLIFLFPQIDDKDIYEYMSIELDSNNNDIDIEGVY